MKQSDKRKGLMGKSRLKVQKGGISVRGEESMMKNAGQHCFYQIY